MTEADDDLAMAEDAFFSFTGDGFRRLSEERARKKARIRARFCHPAGILPPGGTLPAEARHLAELSYNTWLCMNANDVHSGRCGPPLKYGECFVSWLRRLNERRVQLHAAERDWDAVRKAQRKRSC